MKKRLSASAVTIVVVLVVAGCGRGTSVAISQNASPQSQISDPRAGAFGHSGQPDAPRSTVTLDRLATTSPAEPTSPHSMTRGVVLREGDDGVEVLMVQRRLRALGYWLGKPDGRFGNLTQQAVYAIQKAAGLRRDGVIGAQTMAAINSGRRPVLASTGSGHRIEINKATQLLLIVDGKRIVTILNTSTGSGATYLQAGKQHVALTPAGRFRVFRQIDGEDIGPLGALWRPKYFNGGIAIHGLHSVPPYPASHGCARVSIAAMNWIWHTKKAPIGTKVTVV